MKIYLFILILFCPTNSMAAESTNDSAKKGQASEMMGGLTSAVMGGGMAYYGYKMFMEGMAERAAGETLVTDGGTEISVGNTGLLNCTTMTIVCRHIPLGIIKSGEAMQAAGTAAISSGTMSMLGGTALMGMGALSLGQAAADQLGAEESGQTAGATGLGGLPDFDGGATGLTFDDGVTGGSGIFSKGGTPDPNSEITKRVNEGNKFLREQGVSFNPATGIVTTPTGDFAASSLDGSIDGLQKLGLSKEVASLVKNQADSVAAEAGAGGGKGLTKKGILAKGEGAVTGVAEGGAAAGGPFSGVYDQGGSGGSNGGSKSAKKKRSRFNPLDLYKKLNKKRKVAGKSKIKKKLIGGVPVGARHEDIFAKITTVYHRKNKNKYFVP